MEDFIDVVARARRLREYHADWLAEAVVSELGPELDAELKAWRIRLRSEEYVEYRAEHRRLADLQERVFGVGCVPRFAGRYVRDGQL